MDDRERQGCGMGPKSVVFRSVPPSTDVHSKTVQASTRVPSHAAPYQLAEACFVGRVGGRLQFRLVQPDVVVGGSWKMKASVNM